jgi:hypothetical protein
VLTMNWYAIVELMAFAALAIAMTRRLSWLHAGLLLSMLTLIAASILREFSVGISNDVARLLRLLIGFGIALALWKASE